MRRFRVAIVGCGDVSLQRHVPAWQANPRANIAAVCDINEGKVNRVARELGVTSYTDYQEMIENAEIDILDVATPIRHHYKAAIAGIRNGKHVLVEKPIARTTTEAQEMIDLAKARGTKLSVFHTMMAYPVIHKARALLDAGRIGRPILFHSLTTCPRLQSWVAHEGGPLWEVGTHKIYLAQYLFGRVRKFEFHEYDTSNLNIVITLWSERGVCEIHLVSELDFAPDTIHIIGTKGRISLERLAMNTMTIQNPVGSWPGLFLNAIKNNVESSGSVLWRGLSYIVFRERILPHYLIIHNFLEAIEGHAELLVRAEDGLETIRILEGIQGVSAV